MTTYSLTEAADNLSELIDRALRGEGVVVTRHGTPVVELRAIAQAEKGMSQSEIAWLESRRATSASGAELPSKSLAIIRDEDIV